MKKVQCRICAFEAHDLKPHFLSGRAESCSVTLAEYRERHPDAEVESELFKSQLAKIRKAKTEVGDDLTLKNYSIRETFGFSIGAEDAVQGFLERSKYVPDIDPSFMFPREATAIVLMGLQTNRPTMIHGPTGSGKSTLIEQIAARINYPVLRINHHADMYAFDILGQKKVEEGKTVFEYGPLPFAMKRPMILILDEWDALNPEIALQYQPVLERRHTGTLGSVVLTANGAEKVCSHRLFRIFATSNTCGLGDEKGLYQGTQLQNIAFISRFLLRVRLDYLDQKHESTLLKNKFPDLTSDECNHLAKVAKLIRDRFEAGELNVPFSIRDLINWTDLYTMLGNAEKAITYACTSILPFNDAKTIQEIVQRTFG